MSNNFRYIFFLALFLNVIGASQAQDNWNEVKDKDGIKVFTRTNTVMSFKEFKATMIISGKVNDVLSVLFDVEGLTTWGYNILKSELIERTGDSLQIYYAVAKAPWPYKDRDGIYSNKMIWDKELKTLLVEIDLLEKDMYSDNDFVRMDGYGFWKIKERLSGEIEIDFQMQINPGGSIKAWVANMFVSDSPFYTMQKLREALKNEKYQGKTYDITGN
jgi:hypothetical protein